MKYILTLLFLFSSLSALNPTLIDTTTSNGRTSLIEFTKEKGIEYKNIKHGKKTFKIFENPLNKSKMYALVPMSYYQKLDKQKLKITYKKSGQIVSKFIFLNVKDGKYKKEEIRVSKSKVNPKGEKTKKRISKEYNEAMQIYGTVTNESYINSKFILPLDSFITSNFGKARVYNGSLKGYHSGTDFRAKIGTPIIASNDGVVALVKDRFYSGGTVLINHGQGIYTCYFHMSAFSVKVGQRVKKAQLLGLSGKSGRVTGPHLHFAVRINKVQVDPLQFIELMNERIFTRKSRK